MWRVGTPMQISEVNPVNDPARIVGVPPVWYPDPLLEVFLADDSGDLLVSTIPGLGGYLTSPPAP